MKCKESQCNSNKLENQPILDDIQYIMEWKINLFYELIMTEERFCIRQIKKIATVFTYSNISHELKTSKTCQQYLKSYQYDPQNMHKFNTLPN